MKNKKLVITIAVIVVLVVLLDGVVRLLERRLLRWR